MSAQLVDGIAIQRSLLAQAKMSLQDAKVVPEVALILVEGDEPLAAVNFRLHEKIFAATGFVVRPITLPASTTQTTLLGLIERLNEDNDLDAIMTLLPLPSHLDIREVLNTIAPDKEVEGLHPDNVGRLTPLSVEPTGRTPVVPLTMLKLLSEVGFDPTGAHVVVLVDPDLMERNAVAKMVARVGALSVLPPDAIGAVVPVTHPDAAACCRQADLLIVSLDRPGLVTGDWVKPGAVVVDFNAMLQGMHPHPTDPGRLVPQLVGGLDVESVAKVAGTLSAIPGGIGPVMLGILVGQIAQAAICRAKRGTATVVAP